VVAFMVRATCFWAAFNESSCELPAPQPASMPPINPSASALQTLPWVLVLMSFSSMIEKWLLRAALNGALI
jgi:hypothetical protein